MKQQNLVIIILLLVITTSLFSQSTSKVYFTRFDEHFGRVYSDNLGGGSSTILVNNIDRPEGIAIDWSVSPHKIYVGVSGANKIVRYNIDGTNPVDVITGQSGIGDIELDLTNRRIYWLKDTYSDDQIFYANMDGVNSNITSIYATTTTSRNLWGLALDVPNNQLWITERGSNCNASRLRRMTLTGNSASNLDNSICNPHDIEFFNGKIYFLMDDGLIRAYTDGSGQTNLSASVSDALYLAIDRNNSKVYWTNISSVVRANLDGSDETTIFSGVSPLEGIDTDYHNPAATPVELTSFTAHFNKLNDQNIILTWQTATEVNNYGFELERQNQVSSIKNQDKKQIWETIAAMQG